MVRSTNKTRPVAPGDHSIIQNTLDIEVEENFSMDDETKGNDPSGNGGGDHDGQDGIECGDKKDDDGIEEVKQNEV